MVTPALLVLLVLAAGSGAPDPVVWDADDARPIPEPAMDESGDAIWWDGARSMTVYPLGRMLDLGDGGRAAAETLGLGRPVEARNVNALDEAPNSTWFTNRRGRRALSREAILRGPNLGPPPRSEGPLVVTSGKALGATPGFHFRDGAGQAFIAKFDPPSIPEMATGAEMVCSKILWALGWNVPEYHLFELDPARLVIGDGATVKGKYNRKRPMRDADLEAILSRAAGRDEPPLRAIASAFVPGVPKGPFRTQGTRLDDANDTLPHEDRRELRGLSVVAAWLNYTDARRGNFYDTFVRDEGAPEGHGHLVHYVLDFSSALGSGNVEWKSPKLGHEYFFDPLVFLRSVVSFGLWVKPWEDPPPVRHPALGTLESRVFDPERWRTSYPQPLFGRATVRDRFWGAKLVWSIDDDELRAIAGTGGWSDPAVTDALTELLQERRRKIAAAYFDAARIAPLDRFEVRDGRLRFADLGVVAGVVDPALARIRWRLPEGPWVEIGTPEVRVPAGGVLELAVSHDAGEAWSPVTRVSVAGDAVERAVVAVERDTR